MAESPAPDNRQAPTEGVPEESVEDSEPEGPDLSSLGADARLLLDSMLGALQAYDPQPSALSGLPVVTVGRQHVADACRLLKGDDRFGARMLLCLSAVDYRETLQMVYFLQSLDPERTLVLKTDTPSDDPVVPSVTSVWRAADWYEREAHDLFGITFDGHPDPSPLLLYDEFEGHPGRKEFPFNEYREF